MNKNWKKVHLGEIAEEIRELYEPKSSEDLKYIGLEHIEQDTLRINGYGKSSDTHSTKKRFYNRDILFGSLRPYFRKVVKPKFDGVCSTDITVIKSKAEFSQEYLFYLIANYDFIDLASNWTSGTRMPRANWKVLEKSEWYVPIDSRYQRKIASILSAYDDLIENNTRRIRILEEMAQAIYREWFVEFRAPGVKLRKTTPEEQKAIGKDVIPEGWEVVPISDAIEFNPRMEIDHKIEKPYLLMDGLSTNSMIIDTSNIKPKSGKSGSKFKNKDTLLARITPCLENGKTGYVQFLNSDNEVGLGSTEFIVMRSKTLTPEYVYLLARGDNIRDLAIKSMTGASGRQRVRIEIFKNYLIIQPAKEILNNFRRITGEIFKFIYKLNNKNMLLQQTRDLLLPKLVSGEVEV
jgi:type I restriction enzyme, S subunit